ncbi:MAG: hypothetical protein FWF69_00505 [Firmicutes bacterium]|nr:hypothetical protein [Bacillota bacterium]
MRRSFALLLFFALLAMTLPALSEEGMRMAVDAIFDALWDPSAPGVIEATEFSVDGDWVFAVQRRREADGLRWHAIGYDMASERFVTWDDLFADGDAAAERIAQIADSAMYHNAYAEHNRITPVPRDNFALANGVLTVYYPAEQLAHFSGRAGAFGFYAYELADLLREGAPLAVGDAKEAPAAMTAALAGGSLPGYEKWAIGGAMADAAEALGLVDVPDLTYDFAVYRFEDPCMRGVALLSDPGGDSAGNATISGIYAERIDFSGLCAGVSARAECVLALGAPDAKCAIEEADGYSLRPVGETLRWERDGRALELHFVEDVLHSVLLR